jgi:pyridoxamine 5'-phosphate oxidase family protein
MSVFTETELEYLRGQGLGRLATIGRDGQPHVVPLTFWFNADEDSIDLGGIFFGQSKKWRDAEHNQKMTFLIDDMPEPGKARAIEIRGTAELHTTGGDKIHPNFANFKPEFFRLRPTHIVSWGLDGGYNPNSRKVGPGA